LLPGAGVLTNVSVMIAVVGNVVATFVAVALFAATIRGRSTKRGRRGR